MLYFYLGYKLELQTGFRIFLLLAHIFHALCIKA